MREMERLTIALHDEMAAGRGDEDVADGYRDEMDGLWRDATAEQRELASHLSGDLYLLTDKRNTRALADGETFQGVQNAIDVARARRDWHRVVVLMAKVGDGGLPSRLARELADVWRQLGFLETAIRLNDYAETKVQEDMTKLLVGHADGLVLRVELVDRLAACGAFPHLPDSKLKGDVWNLQEAVKRGQTITITG